MTIEELINRVDDGVAALERIAVALERINVQRAAVVVGSTGSVRLVLVAEADE